MRNETFAETVILGASCFAAGRVLEGENVLVIEREARVGAEYFDAWRACPPLHAPFRTQAARQLFRELEERNQLADLYAPGPLLYRMLRDHHSRFRLRTEILDLQKMDDGFLLRTTASGRTEIIRCRRLIDNTPLCISHPAFGRANLVGGRVTSLFHIPGVPPDIWQNAPFAFRSGRTPGEFLGEFSIAGRVDWIETRRAIVEAWRTRPPELAEGRILSLGKCADYEVKQSVARLGENHFYCHAAQFSGPLAALDATIQDDAPEANLPYSEKAEIHRAYDVIVVGGGTAGAIAALTAAENGLAVCCIEESSALGGTGTLGGIPGYYYGLRSGRFDAVDEHARTLRDGQFVPAGSANSDAKAIIFEQELRAAGADIFLESRVPDEAYIKEGCKVRGLRFATTDAILHFDCRFLIDGTANGEACAALGCAFTEGRATDGKCQPFSSVRVRRHGAGIGSANFDAGYVLSADAADMTRAIIHSNALHVKPPQEEQEHICWISPIPGLREGRLIQCDEVLRFRDFVAGRWAGKRPLAYAYANFDSHSRDWAFADAEIRDWMVGASLWGKNIVAPITLGMMLPKGFDNLAVAGRALGVDHLTASLLRMQPCLQKQAEALGLAVAMSLKAGIPVRAVPLAELENRLRASGCLNDESTLPDCSFPEDIATLPQRLSSEKPGEAIWQSSHNIERCRDILLKELHSENLHSRRHSAIALGIAGDATGLFVLREMLLENDAFLPQSSRAQNQRRILAAADLLGRLGTPEDAALLLDVLSRSEEDVSLFTHTFRALVELGGRHTACRAIVREKLRTLLAHEDFECRLLMKNSSETGDAVYTDLRESLQKLFLRC